MTDDSENRSKFGEVAVGVVTAYILRYLVFGDHHTGGFSFNIPSLIWFPYDWVQYLLMFLVILAFAQAMFWLSGRKYAAAGVMLVCAIYLLGEHGVLITTCASCPINGESFFERLIMALTTLLIGAVVAWCLRVLLKWLPLPPQHKSGQSVVMAITVGLMVIHASLALITLVYDPVWTYSSTLYHPVLTLRIVPVLFLVVLILNVVTKENRL